MDRIQKARNVATEVFSDASLTVLRDAVNAWLLAAGESNVLDVQFRYDGALYFAWVTFVNE